MSVSFSSNSNREKVTSIEFYLQLTNTILDKIKKLSETVEYELDNDRIIIFFNNIKFANHRIDIKIERFENDIDMMKCIESYFSVTFYVHETNDEIAEKIVKDFIEMIYSQQIDLSTTISNVLSKNQISIIINNKFNEDIAEKIIYRFNQFLTPVSDILKSKLLIIPDTLNEIRIDLRRKFLIVLHVPAFIAQKIKNTELIVSKKEFLQILENIMKEIAKDVNNLLIASGLQEFVEDTDDPYITNDIYVTHSLSTFYKVFYYVVKNKYDKDIIKEVKLDNYHKLFRISIKVNILYGDNSYYIIIWYIPEQYYTFILNYENILMSYKDEKEIMNKINNIDEKTAQEFFEEIIKLISKTE